MNVDYTGRQYEVTPAIKKQVEAGQKKLAKILGDSFETKVILTVEKHRSIAELTLTSRNRQQLVAIVEADDMLSAVDGALDRVEKQALKNKGRWRNLKRQPKKVKTFEAVEEVAMAVGAAAAPVPAAHVSFGNVGHRDGGHQNVVTPFPPTVHPKEAHVMASRDSVALRPMKLEEAVKECEYRDRDVFVFRDMSGAVNVLHRKKDGKLELIEVP